MAKRRYFTVGEVERMIPRLERIFTQVLQLRGSLRVHERRLQQIGVQLSREVLDEEDPNETPEVRQAKALFRGYYEALAEALAEVGKLGGEVKDLEQGLVDFLGRRGDEDILLCWKLGERRIAYWHTVDSGFAGRKPIDDQVPREPTPLD
jgi:hypothetical protein